MQMYGYYIWNDQCNRIVIQYLAMLMSFAYNQNCNVTTPFVFCFHTEIKAAI